MPNTVEPPSGSVSFDKTFIKIGLHAPVVAASVVATGLWLVIVKETNALLQICVLPQLLNASQI